MDRTLSVAKLCVIALCASLTSGAAAVVTKHLMAGAGPDQRVEEGNKVLLRGSGRVTDGRVVRFAWAQIRGPRVKLQGANRSTAQFIAPRGTNGRPLIFQLTVTDSHGHKAFEMAKITVVPKNQLNKPKEAPVAETNKKPAG